MVGSKKKYRSRSTSASSQDSLSSGSYSGSSSDEEGSPREKIQSNSKGNSDFCVRKIEQHTYGRREIEIAEQEMPGIMALRNKAKVLIIDFCSLFIRVAPFPKSFQIGLPTLWVLPMGTLRYLTKNGPHTMHPREAIGGPIFTTMAM